MRDRQGLAGLSRRRVLLAGLGAGVAVAGGATGYELVQHGVLPGRYTLARLDGACGSVPPPPAGRRPARVTTRFYSRYRRRMVTMVTLLPPAVSSPGPPSEASPQVIVGLHGAGSDALAMARLLAPAMSAARLASTAVVTVDGGTTYWHQRADGDDPVAMIRAEVLPRLAANGLAVGAIGLLGISMGGYGALLMAEGFAAAPTGPVPRAVAALSPAIFGSYAEARAANRTAFDNAADFARHDVVASLAALKDVPVLVSCGTDDPFAAETARLRRRLATLTGHRPAGGLLAGCHDDAFWSRQLPGALRYVAARGA